MAEELAKVTQYQYAANSNLVLQADRSLITSRKNEPTGEPESLYGKIDPKEFGTKAVREQPKAKKEQATKKSVMDSESAKRKREDDQAFSKYEPKTKDTREVFELILAYVSDYMVGVPTELVSDVANEVLELLKKDDVKDLDKKKLIEHLLDSRLESEKFTQLLGLSRKITDYQKEEGMEMQDDDPSRKLQDEGIAVVFDEEEEENDMEAYEVQEDVIPEEDEEEERIPTFEDNEGLEVYEEEDFDPESGFRTEVPGQTKGKRNTAEKLQLREIDAHWLQRKIGVHYHDPVVCNTKTVETLKCLEDEKMSRVQLENVLHQLFDFEHFDLVKLISSNRETVFWCTKLAKAGPEGGDRNAIEAVMKAKGLDWMLRELMGDRVDITQEEDEVMDEVKEGKNSQEAVGVVPKNAIDLESMIFQQGAHLMTNKTCKLPNGSSRRTAKGYEIITVPAPKHPNTSNTKLTPVVMLPTWAQQAFPQNATLNVIQSQVKPVAFDTDENILLCAPTGAGKTNVAMLCVLREIGKHMDAKTGQVDLDSFKIIYVAPMKALVQEMVRNFGERLKGFGIKVAELSGDRQMTKAQITETQIIFTTPEKWDIITRKATERSYTNLVSLIIIDEIHLLHDERGPVLESIVSRTLRTIEQTQCPVRLVGLSATLPNYHDVALFLRVKQDAGLFYFDNSYRPCPLEQQFIGVSEKKPLKRYQLTNEITYEKIIEQLSQGEDRQVLVFVHSRKETAKAGKNIRDLSVERETIGKIIRQSGAVKEILRAESEATKDDNLKDLLPFGIGIHHAGLTAADRKTVEELFSEGAIRVLISTATLAWGVNLPAHAVIIKGTQIYSPEKGCWVELSPQDILQMLGRAGRPQYDTYGEGIIITTQSELQYYLSLLNQQLPIESQLVSRLADALNAEIVLGSIRNREEAVEWLGYSYLYVRMRQNGAYYGVTPEEAEEDPRLVQKRMDIIHAAASLLDKCHMIEYSKKTGIFKPKDLGRIASHYYIKHSSMAVYNEHLQPLMSNIELMRVFALSDEFKFIPVRKEEKLELSKLMERVPIPIKEGIEEPTAKVNVLLQAYISQLRLDGFALMADMVYVTQSAVRILRAIFEICLDKGWAGLTRKTLDLCKMVEKRQWLSMSPLRQIAPTALSKKELYDSFKTVVHKLERKDFPWERMYDLSTQELGELVSMPKVGRLLYKMVHHFPKLEFQTTVQPLMPSLVQIELTITPDFQWDEKIHGTTEQFWIFVEDVNGEHLLYYDMFILKQQYSQEDHTISFMVTMTEPLQPNWFFSVVSDRWLHSERRNTVSFKHFIVPERFPPHTQLLDLQPLPISALNDPQLEELYDKFDIFNSIQTQVFQSLYASDENIFIGAASGVGKTVCAELSVFRLWSKSSSGKAVYVNPSQEMINIKLSEWKKKFSSLYGGKTINSLTGEITGDLKLLQGSDLILCTPTQWDVISRKWKQRQAVREIGLFIADDIHMIGDDGGHTYEIVVSRMRYIVKEGERTIRLVALSIPIGSAKDIAEWIGCKSQNTYNMDPSARSVALEVHFQAFSIQHFASAMIAMTRSSFAYIKKHARDMPTVIFVPTRKHSKQVAAELVQISAVQAAKPMEIDSDKYNSILESMEDQTLAEILKTGVGYYHETLSASDRSIVEELYESGAVKVLICSKDTCWYLPLTAHLVIIMGTQEYHGEEHRYVDYSLADMHKMIGKAGRPSADLEGVAVVMCQHVRKKIFYKDYLKLALPVESHLDQHLHEHFNAEVAAKTIRNKQDAVDYLTWTYLYRRLTKNPNYYYLHGVTNQHISDFLSELVENTVNDLSTAKCVMIDEDNDVTSLNFGMISAYYKVHYSTIEYFSLSLNERIRVRQFLDILSSATEFKTMPIRHREDEVLRRINEHLPMKLANANFNLQKNKVNVLLQAHFSRIKLPADLAADQKNILEVIVPLVLAAIDVIASGGWLKAAIMAMEFCQMCIQAQWFNESPLKQLPHFDQDRIDYCKQNNLENIFELLEFINQRKQEALEALNLQDKLILKQLFSFTMQYPSVDVSFKITNEDQIMSGEASVLKVHLERDQAEIGKALAPFYPHPKDESWWLVVGDEDSDVLLGIKRITFEQETDIDVAFVPQKAGEQKLKLYFMCDSYLGCDQDFEFDVKVEQGEEDSDEDVEMQD